MEDTSAAIVFGLAGNSSSQPASTELFRFSMFGLICMPFYWRYRSAEGFWLSVFFSLDLMRFFVAVTSGASGMSRLTAREIAEDDGGEAAGRSTVRRLQRGRSSQSTQKSLRAPQSTRRKGRQTRKLSDHQHCHQLQADRLNIRLTVTAAY